MTTPNNTGAETALRALLVRAWQALDVAAPNAQITADLSHAIATPPEDAPAVGAVDWRYTAASALEYLQAGDTENAVGMLKSALAAAPAPAVKREVEDGRQIAQQNITTAITDATPPAEARTEAAVKRDAVAMPAIWHRLGWAEPVVPDEWRALVRDARDSISALWMLAGPHEATTPPAEAREPVGVTDADAIWLLSFAAALKDVFGESGAVRELRRIGLSAQPQATPREPAEDAGMVDTSWLDDHAMLEAGRKAWADVPDGAAWQREIRGNDDDAQPDAAAVGKQEAGDYMRGWEDANAGRAPRTPPHETGTERGERAHWLAAAGGLQRFVDMMSRDADKPDVLDGWKAACSWHATRLQTIVDDMRANASLFTHAGMQPVERGEAVAEHTCDFTDGLDECERCRLERSPDYHAGYSVGFADAKRLPAHKGMQASEGDRDMARSLETAALADGWREGDRMRLLDAAASLHWRAARNAPQAAQGDER